MHFPLVPVPEWLANLLPLFFSPEQHQNTVVGAFVVLIAGLAFIMPTVLGENTEVNRHFLISGLVILAIGALLAIFGGYMMLLIAIVTLLFLIWALFVRVPQMLFFKKQ